MESCIEVVGKFEVQEIFKELYPFLLTFSYAVVVESERNKVKYLLLESTLTELGEILLAELKSGHLAVLFFG